MYIRMFRALPGPALVRALIALVLIAAAVAALFLWAFPAIAPYMPFQPDPVS
ncbi:hypothetical protein [Pseudactinotalea sp. HY160]|uniref:hypothetical protein n=1 Tax=Pseudactinotalea sp. HY160 TaxID=2654490 RepID=UPI001883B0B6|nr:hypothetical protein [Pseudactinotalea sp. HY160]